jgi:hypothetical protein
MFKFLTMAIQPGTYGGDLSYDPCSVTQMILNWSTRAVCRCRSQNAHAFCDFDGLLDGDELFVAGELIVLG